MQRPGNDKRVWPTPLHETEHDGLKQDAPKTILTVIGARPQFVKACVLSRAMAACGSRPRPESACVKEIILHTGQHYDYEMSKIFFDELQIPAPAYNLGISNGAHGSMTGRMLEQIESVLLRERPDLVLVYGDTNSTLAGALAAAKLHIPVAHIEAGLRSFNRRMPEEINRVLTDHVATLLFCPTRIAVENLRREGIVDGVFLVGDPMYDAFLRFQEKQGKRDRLVEELGLRKKGYVLATVHRAENTEHPGRLGGIFEGLMEVAHEVPVVVPMHPRTQDALETAGLLGDVCRSLRRIKPVGYLDMAVLEKNALCIATDSGGIQKEAFFHKVPCLTLRDETEWLELVEAGWNLLVGADPDRLVRGMEHFLSPSITLPYNDRLYGDGRSGEKILHHIGLHLGTDASFIASGHGARRGICEFKEEHIRP
jgi:UDP-GlcNAc3NAcA epimerase